MLANKRQICSAFRRGAPDLHYQLQRRTGISHCVDVEAKTLAEAAEIGFHWA
jgi:hypothetical protein